MPFSFTQLEIPEVILIEPKAFGDQRGFFMETYKSTDFAEFGIDARFVQDNHSRSEANGVLRGLHYQKGPQAQAKLIRVISGSIFDVAVDIRRNSPTYGKWVSAVLSSANKKMLYIPVGFAHGFCTLEKGTEIIYKCTEVYSSEYDRGVIWSDKNINISWPINQPILSEKDKKLPSLEEADNEFRYQ